MLKRVLPILLAILSLSSTLRAQETNSSIGGSVKMANGEALQGATITATHEPTGTIYRVVARKDGRYDINNMNPGGPYTIVVSFVNYQEDRRTDVYLSLGEKSRFDFILINNDKKLDEVVIAARRTASGGKGGTETNIGRDRMANLPTVGRNIQDFLRATPQAKLTADGSGVSLAGQNNRYNSFFIDGALNNDVFGLSGSGTNGGQAGIAPISIDAIDQFQVVLSPYDASIGNFTGGGINAITRSGTNTLTGSFYAFYRNQDLTGKTPGNVTKSQRTKLAEFNNKTFGFRLGGAIVKNKIFFFVNAEIQRDVRPQPFNFGDYRGIATRDSLTKLQNFLRSSYGYDAGGYLDNPEEVKANRVTVKLDFNLNSKNKLSISSRYNDGERVNTSTSSSTAINFFNNGFLFPTTTISNSAELRSTFSRNASNRLLITFTDVVDDRSPLGQPFPRVSINDGSGSIIFGTENFSNANLLKQKNYALYDVFKFYAGKNLISLGTDNELNDSYNVFVRDNFGTYQYNSLNDFIIGANPRRYQRSYSLVDNETGDNTAAAAAFKTARIGFFVNDEIRVSDKFTLNLGIRADKTFFLTTPREDKFFNDTAIARITAAGYDLQGARSGQITNVKWSISPRIGFTYRANDESVIVRGGMGLFTGRVPLVWPGGVYNQNGVSIGGVDINPPTAAFPAFFRPNPNGQYTASDFGVSLANAKGQVDLMTKEFRLPKIFRASLGLDKKFGNGWTATFEGVITKNINEIAYENVNIIKPTLVSSGPGSRNVYAASGGTPRIPMRSTGANPYQGNIFLLSNNKGPKGFSYNATFIIDRAFRNGFAFNASYTYGGSSVLNEGTSSQNNSQWRFMETVNGRNFMTRSRSDFDLGHRINGYVSKTFNYANKRFATTISLVYIGQSGNPFSYVYRNAITNDNGTAESNDLIYVPTAAEVSTMLFDNVTVNGVVFNAATQARMLNDYIEGNKYLRKRRGKFAERNGDRLPFTNNLDLKIQQDINFKIGGKKYQVQLSYDVFNFGNMLNPDWGRTFFLANDNFQLLQFNGYTATSLGPLTPRYTFRPQNGAKPWGLSTSTAPGISARWVSQVGARINF